MTHSTLPIPNEPRSLRVVMRTLLEQAPDEGLPLVLAGDWIADPLWERWGETLARRRMSREQFGDIVGEYGNELRLWVVGERPWDQAIGGLAGRIGRRLDPLPSATGQGTPPLWQEALGRVGIGPEIEMTVLISRIGELQLLFDVLPHGPAASSPIGGTPTAIVWAGARPRDPEVPYGESHAGSSSVAALAEALGRFLLKDAAYPPDDWMI